MRLESMELMRDIMKTLILGGGLSGLVLGNLLKEKDEITILEKNPECGGLCRSITENGFTFDWGGSHIIFSKDDEVLKLMVHELGDNIVKNRRNTKIFFKKKFVKYPFENGLSELPKKDNFECLYYFIQTLTDSCKKKPQNFREWIYQTFGKGIAEKYMIPYNEKIWNYKTDMMNTEWIAGRVPKPPVEDIIKSAIGIETEGYTHQLHFYYPKTGGIQAMVKAFEEPIKKRIVTDFEVKSIRKGKDGFVVSNGATEHKCKRLISTLPLPDIINFMENVPKDVKDAAKELKYNSLVTVMLGIDTPKINDISWLYVPSEDDGMFNRVSFPSNYSPVVAPEGKSSVLAEITCRFGDDVWKMKDEEIADRVVLSLSKMGIFDKKKVSYTLVKRSKYAYIIYDIDYTKNTEIVKNYLNCQEIELVGRFAEFKYLNMDACIRSVLDFVKEQKIDH